MHKFIQVTPLLIVNEGDGNIAAVEHFPPTNGEMDSVEIHVSSGHIFHLTGENAMPVWHHYLLLSNRLTRHAQDDPRDAEHHSHPMG